jgi:hypothetical protein
MLVRQNHTTIAEPKKKNTACEPASHGRRCATGCHARSHTSFNLKPSQQQGSAGTLNSAAAIEHSMRVTGRNLCLASSSFNSTTTETHLGYQDNPVRCIWANKGVSGQHKPLAACCLGQSPLAKGRLGGCMHDVLHHTPLKDNHKTISHALTPDT